MCRILPGIVPSLALFVKSFPRGTHSLAGLPLGVGCCVRYEDLNPLGVKSARALGTGVHLYKMYFHEMYYCFSFLTSDNKRNS